MPLISFVLPAYNEASGIADFHDALVTALQAVGGHEFEFVYVNDGSRDETAQCLHRLAEADPRVRVLSFSRNFGHQMAITAGLDHARGDAVVVMDTDLQDPPHVAVELIAKWDEGFAQAYAQRISRNDRWFKRVTANVFYRVMESMSEVPIPRDVSDFRIADRQVVDEVLKFREHARYLRGVFPYVGFTQTAVGFHRDGRHSGESGYSLRTMLRLAADGALGFSSHPLRLVRNVGLAIAALAFSGALYVLGAKLVAPENSVPGWALIMITILFVGAMQIVLLSIVGSYVGRIFTEVKQRPLYVIEHDSGAPGSSSHPATDGA